MTNHDFSKAKKVNCDLCNSKDSIEIPHIKQYTNGQAVDICTNCGFVYFRYRRTPEELAKFWEEEMFAKGEYTSKNPTFISRHVYSVEFINTYLELNNISVIDIGAGEGQFLSMLKNKGASVYGVESAKRNSKLLSDLDIEHYNGTIEEFALSDERKNKKYDLATILWTLQNSQSCIDMLNATYDSLKDDGYLHIQLGSRILVPFKKPMGTYFSNLPQDDQPYHFSINTLRGVLAKTGFEIKATNHYWDQDILCILAKKRNRTENIFWEKDNYLQVFMFFERWHEESIRMKEYLNILKIEYKLSKTHNFYKSNKEI